MAKQRKWLTAWVPHRLEMLLSPAWRSAPSPLRRVIERLEIEHLRHGGANNGHLFVSFGQFVEHGVSKRNIAPSLDLGEALGLVVVTRPTQPSGDIRGPNSYRLTYVPAKGSGGPTDEWKAITSERASRALAAFREADNERRKQTGKTRKEAA